MIKRDVKKNREEVESNLIRVRHLNIIKICIRFS
jgi:hypothetical protein